MTQTAATAHDSDSRRAAGAAELVAIDDELLLSLEERYLDSLLAGEELDPEELIAQHPRIADALRRRLSLIAAMHRAAPAAFESSPVAPRQDSRTSADDREQVDRSESLERSALLSRSDRATLGDRTTIGRFEIVKVAGRGAFGVVLKARDSQLGRWVAIKIPHAGFLRTAEERERFLREARTAASLQHPHIVAVHEIGEDNGLPYIVTDYIDGPTLADSAARSRLSARAVATLVAQVAEALAVAHAQQIVHRDIKPGNILLKAEGQGLRGEGKTESALASQPLALSPFITDFGLARIGSESSTLTTEGQLLGTPAYMSPEQAAGQVDQLDARCDLYSLGVVLYELLTGEPPFRGSPRMVIQQVLRDEPRPPRTLDDRIPRDLETICLKAMAKEPNRRFQTAQQFADDLQRYLRGEPIHARRVGRAERAWRWCQRNPIIASLLTTVAALLIAIVGLSLWGYFRESAIRAQAERRRERAEELLGSLVTQADRHGSAQSRMEDMERELYRLSIESAERSLRMGDAVRAREVLAQQQPAEGHVDRRGWEWFHLVARAEGREVFREVSLDANVNTVADQSDDEKTAFGDASRTTLATARSPDGERLASAGSDLTVRLWDTDDRTNVLTLRDVSEPITRLSWSDTGHRLTGVTHSGQAFQWSIRPELSDEPAWPVWRQQARAAVTRNDLEAARRLVRQLRDWAGREASDALCVREKLLALSTTAELLQQHDLLADAIAMNEQLLSFNVARLARDLQGGTPFVAVAAQQINEAARRLLSASELSIEARRAELERLLDELFPYGRGETPIPFRVRPANAVAATWQVPQIVVELARSTGELPRLRSDWDRHPLADGVPMLALRAEASAAAGDSATTDQLLQQLATHEAFEPLPLWSEACVLTPLRRRLTRVRSGFDEFTLSSSVTREHVTKSTDELHIAAPVNGGELQRLGVLRRQPIRGDFEISVNFQVNDFQPPRRVGGLYLQLDLLEGGEMLHFSRVLSRDVGHELVAYQTQVTRDENFFARMWRFPGDLRTGQLTLARRDGILHWFFAEAPGQPARLIHAQTCPETDVAAVWLFVDYRHTSTQNVVDVLCRGMTIRTER